MSTLLQINVDGNAISTGKIADEIGNLAIKKGWKSYIAIGRSIRPSNSKIIRIGSRWSIYIHGLKTRLFDMHGLGSKNATRKFIKQVKLINPDIIHLHTLHGYYINYELLFRFLSISNIHVVWTLHDCWAFTGHCPHFESIGCLKWQTECNHCPLRKEHPSSILIDRSRENFQLKKLIFTSVNRIVLVTVSKWLNQIVNKSFLGPLPTKIIYNGVNVNEFNPTANTLEVRNKYNLDNKTIILSVANLFGPKKGWDDFIKLSSLTDDDIVFILVGLPKNKLKNLPTNIIGLPQTENRAKLKDLYVTADIYMNLSVQETFGLTTAEALACGTPAIVYDVTACPEVIDNKTGIVVPKGDFKELLNAVATIKQKGKAYYEFECRQRAIKLFNKNERFAEYIDLYEEILDKKNRK